MPRKGRFLEILVKHLQDFLGPQGLEVKSPHLFYQHGKQIGEIDVTVRGQLGSSSIFIGVECRDRPQDGPQGIPWLTQINGKQHLLGTDKMIAVSTTGFVPEALVVADKFKIDLLTISNADEIDLADWFYTIDFRWQKETHEITGAIDISTEPKTIKDVRSVKADTPFLKLNNTNQFITLDEFIKRDLDRLFLQLPNVDSGMVQAEAVIHGVGLDAELDGEKFKITDLAIPVKLYREVVGGGLLLNTCKNTNQDEVVAVTGVGTFKTSKRNFRVIAVAKKSTADKNLRDLRVNFLTEDNEPYNVPAGTKVALYGKK